MSEFSTKAGSVNAGKDRFKNDNMMIWGLLPLSIKVSGKDTNGQVLLFEHNSMGKGGPPRHIHHEQDEWFYVIKGDYVFEVGDERFELTSGDTLFAPRKVVHGWANVGDEPGTLLTMVSPVGAFEEFILETTEHAELPTPEEMEKAFTNHGMTIVGPPLAVD